MGEAYQARPYVCEAPGVTIVMDKLVDISVIKAYSLISLATSRLRPLGILSASLLKILIVLSLQLILI